MISTFDPNEAELALHQLFEPTVSSKLRWEKPRAKYAELIEMLDPKITRPVAREFMEAIRAFTGNPDDLAKDTNLKRLLEPLRQS